MFLRSLEKDRRLLDSNENGFCGLRCLDEQQRLAKFFRMDLEQFRFWAANVMAKALRC
jgi:hypothetical protein